MTATPSRYRARSIATKENLARAGVAVYGYLTGSRFTTTDGAGQTVPQNRNATIDDLKTARPPAFLAHGYFQQMRQRLGFTGTMQSRPSDNFTLTANAIVIRGNYENFSDSEHSYDMRGSQRTAATIGNGLIAWATFAATNFGPSAEWYFAPASYLSCNACNIVPYSSPVRPRRG